MRPEYNATGIDYRDRRHLNYAGPPLIDVHAHVTRTRAAGASDGSAPTLDQARLLLDTAAEFGVGTVWSMGPPEDVAPLREAFGERIQFIASISKRSDEPDDAAYALLDRFLAQGVRVLKFWAAPRGRERGLFVDAPWRIESARRAHAAGVRVIACHIADPDAWFRTHYADASKFGTKEEQYAPFVRLLEMFPDVTFIGAHMGGDPEHPDHLEALLERYPNLMLDTSATRWQVREMSARREEIRALICRHAQRFLWGSDLVTRPELVREHYVSRYWCQRTLCESAWRGPSPIADPDHNPADGEPSTPTLHGLNLPAEVLHLLYHDNARRVLPSPS